MLQVLQIDLHVIFLLQMAFDITMSYCKRCYFRGINFSRLAAQKHIRGLLNSR